MITGSWPFSYARKKRFIQRRTLKLGVTRAVEQADEHICSCPGKDEHDEQRSA